MYQIELTRDQETGLAYAADQSKEAPAVYLQDRVGDLCNDYFR